MGIENLFQTKQKRFAACFWRARPAIHDTATREFYPTENMALAREWACDLNKMIAEGVPIDEKIELIQLEYAV